MIRVVEWSGMHICVCACRHWSSSAQKAFGPLPLPVALLKGVSIGHMLLDPTSTHACDQQVTGDGCPSTHTPICEWVRQTSLHRIFSSLPAGQQLLKGSLLRM